MRKFLLIILSLVLFIVSFQALNVKRVSAFSDVAPITTQKIDACLAAGKSAQTCLNEALDYLNNECGLACRGPNGEGSSGSCSGDTCTINCGNGVVINFPNDAPAGGSPPGGGGGGNACPANQQPGTECQKQCSNDLGCGVAYLWKFDDSCKCVNTKEVVNHATCEPSKIPGLVCKTTPTATGKPPGGPTVTSKPPGGPTATVPPSRPTATVAPTKPPPPTATPTPPFNEAMCKCDSLKYSPILVGEPLKVTAFGKVEGTDTQYAKIPSFTFKFFESGTGTQVKELKSQKVNATALPGATSTLVRYQADWTLQLDPKLDTSKTYRIQAKPECSRKAAFIGTETRTAVLAVEDENVSFLDRIAMFFAGLFGGGDTSRTALGPSPTPTLTPDQRRNLQIGTIKPASRIEEGKDLNNCTFIRFSF